MNSHLRTKPQNKPFNLIDVFSGAGGLSLGFSKIFGQNFVSTWAIDNDPACAETYNANFGAHCVVGDVDRNAKHSIRDVPKADVVVGGSPCQAFSLLNKSRAADPRRKLWRAFLQIVEAADAEVFVLENVPQFLASREFANLASTAKQMGFGTSVAILNATDYGVPQKRSRAFVIGSRTIDPSLFFPPRKTHYDPSKGVPMSGVLDYVGELLPWSTLRDAIADLPPPEGVDIRSDDPPMNLHFSRRWTALSQRRYETVASEGMNRFDLQRLAPGLTPKCWKRKKSGGSDLFGRLWWDKPSVTIRTEFFKPEKGRYLHPSENRPLTHREAARLQSFPDSFRFIGSKIEIAKQIGNAVPPLLAASIASCVSQLIARSYEINNNPMAREEKTGTAD